MSKVLLEVYHPPCFYHNHIMKGTGEKQIQQDQFLPAATCSNLRQNVA